jgi:hypothetical protein
MMDGERDRSMDMHIGAYRRKYLPTLAELIDRLSIVLLKEVFLQEHSAEYRAERALIEHDIDAILTEKRVDTAHYLNAGDVRAVLMLMLSNRVIWENESRARAGEDGQDHLLKFTHSVNGVRNTAKNAIAAHIGDRKDFKIDCFAADLIEEFGNWGIFE